MADKVRLRQNYRTRDPVWLKRVAYSFNYGEASFFASFTQNAHQMYGIKYALRVTATKDSICTVAD